MKKLELSILSLHPCRDDRTQSPTFQLTREEGAGGISQAFHSEEFRGETSLFLHLCGFTDTLQQIGLSELSQVPVALVSPPFSNSGQRRNLFKLPNLQEHPLRYFKKVERAHSRSAPSLPRNVTPSDYGREQGFQNHLHQFGVRIP